MMRFVLKWKAQINYIFCPNEWKDFVITGIGEKTVEYGNLVKMRI